MFNNLFYYCQAVFMSDTKGVTDINFVDGVQSLSISETFDTVSFADFGRDKRTHYSYLEPANEITINRISSNLMDLFSVVLVSEPFSYKDGLILKPANFGHSITGDDVFDIKQFDIIVAYGSNAEPIIGENLLDLLELKRCLLTNLTVNMSASGQFSQDLTFINKIILPLSLDTPIDTGWLPLQPEITFRPHFDKENSVLPTEVMQNIDFGAQLDGSDIYGIQDISVSLNIDYTKHRDNGLWGGSTNPDEVNQWVSIQLPITVTSQFTVHAQRGHQFEIENSDKNFTRSRVRLLNKFIDPDTSNLKYYVIDLGANNILKSFSSNSGGVDGSLLEYTFEYENIVNDFSIYIKENLDFSDIEEA